MLDVTLALPPQRRWPVSVLLRQAFFAGGLVLLSALPAFAQSTESWATAGSSAWLTASHWSPATVPGSLDTAVFGNSTTNYPSNTGGVPAAGISMSSNGGAQAVGSIVNSTPGTSSLTIFDSSASTTGLLTLNGASVSGVSNTILANTATNSGAPTTLTIAVTDGSGTDTLGMVLGATTNVIQAATVNKTGGGASSQGDTVAISSNITEANAGSSITFLGSGTSAVNGGILALSGTNSFTGGITVGNSAGTQGGTLQLAGPTSLPSTGSVLVEPNSQFLLNAAGTYGAVAQSLTINGPGTIGNSGALTQSGVVIWQGTTNLASNSIINASGSSGSITLSGQVNDNGYLLQKQGGGNLILSATNNMMTGATQIGNGTLTVNAGSSMGTGNLTLAQTSTNNTTLVLNNTSQSVTDLSASWTATTGSQTQTVTLNGTTLTVHPTTNDVYGNGVLSTLAGTIAGTGGLTVTSTTGAGVLTLTGTNTYSGPTSVTAGELYVNGSQGLATPISANYTIAGNTAIPAVLGGNGTIYFSSTTYGVTAGQGGNAGAIAPAASSTTPGELIVNGGNVNLASSTGKLSILTNGSAMSELMVTGVGATATISGAALVITDPTNAVQTLGSTYTILSATTLPSNTTFAGLANGATLSDGTNTYSINYNYTAGAGAVTLTVTAVPEPSTLTLIALAVVPGALWARRRIQRRRSQDPAPMAW